MILLSTDNCQNITDVYIYSIYIRYIFGNYLHAVVITCRYGNIHGTNDFDGICHSPHVRSLIDCVLVGSFNGGFSGCRKIIYASLCLFCDHIGQWSMSGKTTNKGIQSTIPWRLVKTKLINAGAMTLTSLYQAIPQIRILLAASLGHMRALCWSLALRVCVFHVSNHGGFDYINRVRRVPHNIHLYRLNR